MSNIILPQTIYSKSIVEATYKTVNLIMNKGKLGKDERGETVRYYKHIINIIPVDCCEDSDNLLTFLCGKAFADNLITGKPSGEGLQAHDYTYGEELHFDDGLEKTIELLSEHPETRRAVYLFKPKHVGGKEVPCMIQTVFDIESDEDDDFLNITIPGRSNECAIAMKSDIKGFAELTKYVAKRLGIKTGILLLHDINAHCRINSDMGEIKRILKAGY